MSQTEREGASPSPFCKKLQPALDYYDILSLRGRLKKSSSRCFVRKKGHLRDGKGVTAPPPSKRRDLPPFVAQPFLLLLLFRSPLFFSLLLLFLLPPSQKNSPHRTSGRNDGGQLGVGPEAVVPKLSHPRGVRRWAALALSPGAGSPPSAASTSASASSSSPPPTAATGHAAGVDGSGDVYIWGRNDHGQLGIPPGPKREAPARMSILKGWDVRAIACG